jgi:hypothetical protein
MHHHNIWLQNYNNSKGLGSNTTVDNPTDPMQQIIFSYFQKTYNKTKFQTAKNKHTNTRSCHFQAILPQLQVY